jgi:acyl carrier protein phosphodiesterase
MNFLAHLYLSGDNEELKFGNFIGDWIKGNKYLNYVGDIRNGILLHRDIDGFTDNHPIVDKSVERLRPAYGKHAAVAVDILYDHFLAKYWHEYSDKSLKKYVKSFHKYVLMHFHLLPAGAKRFAFPFIRNRRLLCYADLNCFEDVLNKMAIYTSMPHKVKDAMYIITLNYHEFEIEFRIFLADVQEFVRTNKLTFRK